ncbi:MAG: hypothetical protein H7246_05000 [Phycisphaerae bacterium]|nr:hypothetical protein [Saprospiraceae bacterium]
MLKLLLIPILFSLPSFASGQAPNFFVEGSRWVYQTSESWEPGQPFGHDWVEQNIIHGDTLIGGVLYHKVYSTIHATTTVYQPYPEPPLNLYDEYSFGPTFIRHDPVQNKVYYLPSIDSTERLIYDFNLKVGDTLPMQSIIFPIGVVDSIENVALFGASVKKFYTSQDQDGSVYQENYILEGMGGSNGLTFYQPVFLSVSGSVYSTNLVCFQSGDSIYSPLNGDCPFLEYVSTTHAVSEEVSVVVAPNPTQGVFTVLVGETLRNATFIATDCFGRKLQSILLTEQNTSGQLPSEGVYFWRIEKEGRVIRAGKLICE